MGRMKRALLSLSASLLIFAMPFSASAEIFSGSDFLPAGKANDVVIQDYNIEVSPKNPATGDTITITASIENISEFDINRAFDVEFFMRFTKRATVQSLKAGERKKISVSFPVQDRLWLGVNTLITTIDPEGLITHDDTRNNMIEKKVYLGVGSDPANIRPDLAFKENTAFLSKPLVKTGDTSEAFATIYNNSNVDMRSPFMVYAVLTANSVADVIPERKIVGVSQFSALKSRQQEQIKVPVSFEPFGQETQYRIDLYADLDSAIDENNEENNEISIPFETQAVGKPDITIGTDNIVIAAERADGDLYKAIYMGDTLYVKVPVENNTPAAIKKPFTVQLLINDSTKRGLDKKDVRLTFDGLAPFQKEDAIFRIPLDSDFEATEWASLSFSADIFNDIDERQEDNNYSGEIRFVIQERTVELPDLSIIPNAFSLAPVNPNVDETFFVKAIIKNNNFKPALGGFYVEGFLSQPKYHVHDDQEHWVYQKFRINEDIGAYEEKVAEFKFHVPPQAPAGDHLLVFRVDTDNDINEEFENNNEESFWMYVGESRPEIELPDLLVKDFEVLRRAEAGFENCNYTACTFQPGDDIKVRTTIKNLGLAKVPFPYNVKMTYAAPDQNGNYGTEYYEVRNTKGKELAVQETQVIEADFSVPKVYQSGEFHELTVSIDNNGDVAEENEWNNGEVRNIRVVIGPPPSSDFCRELKEKVRRGEVIEEGSRDAENCAYYHPSIWYEWEDIPVETPYQIAPYDGTEFFHYPRNTLLEWGWQPQAKKYIVEIDCFDCIKAGQWSSEALGKPWQLTETENYWHEFTFVGDNRGRWRVWAVGANGDESAKSQWWEFKYDTSNTAPQLPQPSAALPIVVPAPSPISIPQIEPIYTVAPRPIPPAGFERIIRKPGSSTSAIFSDVDLNELRGKSSEYLYHRSVIGGYPDGEFKGSRDVNRVEVAKFLLLARYGRVDEGAARTNFPDVVAGEWYEKYANTAARLGIIKGYPDGTFKPGQTVNTVEFIAMLSRAFELEKEALLYKHDFVDVPQNEWFAKYAGLAAKYNLFPERDRRLQPDKTLNRYEVATAIYQFLTKSGR